MLLLHGGSNAYRSGLLVLQHVSEALEVGGGKKKTKEGGRKKKGTMEAEEGGSRVPYQVISHLMDAATHTWKWYCGQK